MIKITRINDYNVELHDHDEDGKHRGGFCGPPEVLDAIMNMQEQAQRYRADSLFAAAGVTATAPSERETAYRWFTLGRNTSTGRFEVMWNEEQARNQQKQEVHNTRTTYHILRTEDRRDKPVDDGPCVGDYVLPRTTIEGVPLDMLVSMWLSDQLSWKRYTEELKRRGFKPEEVAAAREEREQEQAQEKRELLGPELTAAEQELINLVGPELPTEDGSDEAVNERLRAALSADIEELYAGSTLQGILRRMLDLI